MAYFLQQAFQLFGSILHLRWDQPTPMLQISGMDPDPFNGDSIELIGAKFKGIRPVARIIVILHWLRLLLLKKGIA